MCVLILSVFLMLVGVFVLILWSTPQVRIFGFLHCFQFPDFWFTHGLECFILASATTNDSVDHFIKCLETKIVSMHYGTDGVISDVMQRSVLHALLLFQCFQ